MGEPQEYKLKLTQRKKNLIQNVVDYIYSLSKEMNILGTQGVIGNELELIALVRNCKFLYDKNQPDFKDIRKKNAAWNAIATVMNASVLDVQQRWRCLRETYNKYTKELECAADLESPNSRVWEYYEDMKFIDPYIVHRRTYVGKLNSFTLYGEDSEECLKEDKTELLIANELPGDVFKLIASVKAKPMLYDNKNIDFKNKELKLLTWNNIALMFGISAEECESRWKRLRERYGRERKLMQKGVSDGKSWQYFDALSFLDSFVKPRRQSVYISLKNKEPEQEATDLRIIQVNTNSDNTIIIKPEELQNPLHLSNTDEIPEDVRHMELIDNINSDSPRCSLSPTISDNQNTKNVSVSPTLAAYTQDEDDLFGQMIAAELKAMPRGKKKMKLKADMYRLLYENESD